MMRLPILAYFLIVSTCLAQQDLDRIKARLLSERLNPLVLARSEATDLLGRLDLEFDTPTFMRCIQTKDVAGVKLFLTAGADPNARVFGFAGPGQTPLIQAVFGGDTNIVMLLVASGADVDGRDGDGSTPLIKAANIGQGEIARYLIAQGADAKARTTLRSHALQGAAGKGDIGLARILLSKGLGINEQDLMGNTALMGAARRGQKEMLQFLLSRGADPTLKTRDGMTAIDFALETGRTACIAMLREAASRSHVSK